MCASTRRRNERVTGGMTVGGETMNEQVLPSRRRHAVVVRPATWSLIGLLMSLALTQGGCLLTSEIIYLRRTHNRYTCRATFVDTSNGEQRVVESSMLARMAPGAPAHDFFDNDWDGNGVN